MHAHLWRKGFPALGGLLLGLQLFEHPLVLLHSAHPVHVTHALRRLGQNERDHLEGLALTGGKPQKNHKN